MKKKSVLIVALIIIMAFTSLMAACGSGDEPVTDADQQTTEISHEVEQTEVTSKEAETETTKVAQNTEITEATKVVQTTEITEATKVAQTAEITEVTKVAQTAEITEATRAKTDDNKANSETSNQEDSKHQSKPTQTVTKPAEKPTKQPTKSTEAKKVCYITVDGCCSNKQIQLKGGESVYDVLKQTGADISARNTGYGVYVEGINGRFEFDEGPTSGWVYTVNGTRPSVSCSGYDVKSGDKIVWTYVTEV